MSTTGEPVPFEVYEPGVYLHGTKADLAVGDVLVPGRESNFEEGRVMNKRFRGNPTQSFRSRAPLRVVGELADWVGHSPEKLQAMQDGLKALNRQGAAEIED